MVMRYAPVGVFALISVNRRYLGFASLVAASCFGVAGLLCDPVLRAGGAGDCRAPVWSEHLILIRILKDELILAYSTASSESVLPRIIEKMNTARRRRITSFVVPTGYPSTSMVQRCIRASRRSIAQLYGIDLSIWQEITLVLTLMVTSKGIAGVPGVSFVVLLATPQLGSRWKGLPYCRRRPYPRYGAYRAERGG